MLIGTVRPRETTTAEVEARSLEEAHTLLEQQAPAGFVLTDAPGRMVKGTDTGSCCTCGLNLCYVHATPGADLGVEEVNVMDRLTAALNRFDEIARNPYAYSAREGMDAVIELDRAEGLY